MESLFHNTISLNFNSESELERIDLFKQKNEF